MREKTDEIVICAAIQLEGGQIFRGHRHNDCLRTWWDIPIDHRPKSARPTQGFITSRNRFVDRTEGLRLQQAAGIASARGEYHNELYSEDLY